MKIMYLCERSVDYFDYNLIVSLAGFLSSLKHYSKTAAGIIANVEIMTNNDSQSVHVM